MSSIIKIKDLEKTYISDSEKLTVLKTNDNKSLINPARIKEFLENGRKIIIVGLKHNKHIDQIAERCVFHIIHLITHFFQYHSIYASFVQIHVSFFAAKYAACHIIGSRIVIHGRKEAYLCTKPRIFGSMRRTLRKKAVGN
jgi:hypothetical protein